MCSPAQLGFPPLLFPRLHCSAHLGNLPKKALALWPFHHHRKPTAYDPCAISVGFTMAP